VLDFITACVLCICVLTEYLIFIYQLNTDGALNVIWWLCFPEDITFDEVPAEQFPRLYDDALIICKVSGQPTPTVSWRYRGTKIRPSTSIPLHHRGPFNIDKPL